MSCSTPNLEPQLFTVLEIGGAVVSFAMVSRWFRETNDCPKNKPTYLQTDEELLLMVEKGESPIQYLSTHPIFKLQLFTVLDLGNFWNPFLLRNQRIVVTQSHLSPKR